MGTKELINFIVARHDIYKRRVLNWPKPWTTDPILQKYRFCNVYRELDKVTIWIRENWREPYDTHKNLWFAMVMARLVNHPETLKQLGFPVQWNKGRAIFFMNVMYDIVAAGDKAFGSAYIVSTNGITMPKAEYLVKHVLNPMWENREILKPKFAETLDAYHFLLCQQNGLGSFLAAQVVADLKHSSQMTAAPDWQTFAAYGPGSLRGLNRVMGRDKDSPLAKRNWNSEFRAIHEVVINEAEHRGLTFIDGQDLQNCLCEFDKYERTRLGEGRPRQTYPGV